MSSYLAVGTHAEIDGELILTDYSGKEYEFQIRGENLVLNTEIDTGINTDIGGQGEEIVLEKGMEFGRSNEE